MYTYRFDLFYVSHASMNVAETPRPFAHPLTSYPLVMNHTAIGKTWKQHCLIGKTSINGPFSTISVQLPEGPGFKTCKIVQVYKMLVQASPCSSTQVTIIPKCLGTWCFCGFKPSQSSMTRSFVYAHGLNVFALHILMILTMTSRLRCHEYYVMWQAQ